MVIDWNFRPHKIQHHSHTHHFPRRHRPNILPNPVHPSPPIIHLPYIPLDTNLHQIPYPPQCFSLTWSHRIDHRSINAPEYFHDLLHRESFFLSWFFMTPYSIFSNASIYIRNGDDSIYTIYTIFLVHNAWYVHLPRCCTPSIIPVPAKYGNNELSSQVI